MVSLHYMLGENMNETFNPDFMKRAIALSRKAAIEEKSGGVFGCVIVKDGKIISEGGYWVSVVMASSPTDPALRRFTCV